MGQYIVRRLLQAIPMLLLISIILFALVNIAPGGPLTTYSRSNRIPPKRKKPFGVVLAWTNHYLCNTSSGWSGMTGWQSIPIETVSQIAMVLVRAC
jgi:ABC-type dipeptide/oligopeptide/nickel transport system permease component